jgi:hypothetical protein
LYPFLERRNPMAYIICKPSKKRKPRKQTERTLEGMSKEEREKYLIRKRLNEMDARGRKKGQKIWRRLPGSYGSNQ